LLIALGAHGIARQFEAQRGEAVEVGQRAVGSLLTARLEQLRREARAVAEDPAVGRGIQRRDWSAIPVGDASRLLSGPLEPMADFLIISDADGGPLVQVPPGAVRSASLARDPASAFSIVDSVPFLVSRVPVMEANRLVGAVVVGRRVDRFLEEIQSAVAPLELAFVTGASALTSTLRDTTGVEWGAAASAGNVSVRGVQYVVRSIGGGDAGRLLVLVPDPAPRSQIGAIFGWLVAVAVLFAGAAVAGAWLLARSWPTRAPERRGPDADLIGTAFRRIAEADDIAAAAPDVLERILDGVGAEAGAIFRARADTGVLEPIAQRGIGGALGGGHVRDALRPGGLLLAGIEPDAQVVCPISAGGGTWGVIAVGSRRSVVAEATRALVEAAAVQFGAAIDRSGLRGEVRERAAQVESLTRLTRAVAATPSLEDVFEKVVANAGGLVPNAAAWLWVVEDDALVLCSEPEPTARRRVAIGQGLAGFVAASREPLVVEDVLGDPRTLTADWLRERGYVSAVHLPLVFRDRLCGVLGVLTRERHEFTDAELHLLSAFANQAAVALEHSRLYEDVSRRATRMRTLAETGRLLMATLEPSRILAIVTAQCREALEVDDVDVFLLDEGRTRLSPLRATLGEGRPLAGGVLTPGEGTVGRAVAEQRPVWSADVISDPALRLGPEARRRMEMRGSRAELAVPFTLEQAAGALVVSRPRGASFSPAEVEFVSALTNHAAVALANARLFSLEHGRRVQIEALVESERELAAELDVDRLLRLISERAAALLGMGGAVWLPDESGLLVVAASHALDDCLADVRLEMGADVPGACARERHGILTNDYASAVGARPELVRRGVARMLAQPLVIRDHLLGVIAVTRGAGEAPFAASDQKAFESLALQAATALENARLFSAERERQRHLTGLLEINKTLASVRSTESLLSSIAEEAARLLRVDNAGFRLVDGDDLVLAGLAGKAAETMIRPRVKFGESLSGRIAVSGETLVIDDLISCPGIIPEHVAADRRLGYTTFLGVPLRAGTRTIGILTFRGHRKFGAREVELAEFFAGQAAIALENARLYDEARRYGERLEALDAVNHRISASLQLDEVLHNIAAATARFFDAPYAAVWVADDAQRRVRRSVVVGGTDLADALPGEYQFGEGGVGWVVENREPIWWTDLRQDRRIGGAAVALRHGLRFFAGFPVTIGDRVPGVITVFRSGAPPITPEATTLMKSLTTQAAVALDNARLYAETRMQLRDTTALLAVARALSQPDSTDKVLRQVAREIGHAFDAGMVGAYMLDERTNSLQAVAGWHVPPEYLDYFRRTPFVPERFAALRDAWTHGRPQWSSDVHGDMRFDQDIFKALPPHSMLFAPTSVRGEPVGALFVTWWKTGRMVQPAEIRLIEGMASQVGLAMENAELTRRTQRKLEETETLLEVARSLTATLDLPQLLRHFLRHVQRTSGADSTGLWLADPGSHWMTPVAGYHVPKDRLEAWRGVKLSTVEHALYAEACRTKQSVGSPDAQDDPRLPPELRRPDTAHRSQLFVPVVAKDAVIGGFLAVWWNDRHEFSPGELALLEAVASQAGSAIENARLFTDLQHKLENLAALYELSRAVTGQLDREALVENIHRQVSRVLDARTMVVLLYDETRQEFEVALRTLNGAPRPEEAGRRYPLETGLMSRVVQRRASIRTDNYSEACRREGVAPIDSALKFPYWLGVPMIAGDEVIGVLALRSDSRPFQAEDERLLENIAGLAALAFRSARLYEDRMRAYSELAAAQDQLIRAAKLRALGEMASGVAHDFNNILMAIVGRTQLLLRHVDDAQLRRWLDGIERAALDGSESVRRIQEFTRVRRDQAFEAVDLNRVVEEALDVTQSRWRDEPQSRGIDLQVATELEPVPFIGGDAAELREALTNLILNAVEAMPDGGILTVRTRADRDSVRVVVADTGIGLNEEVKRRLFEPYFTTKIPGGAGLGLSLTFGIVSRHGGQIEADGAPGEGARFEIRFPLSTSPAGADRAGAVADEHSEQTPAHCLVVDDEELVRETIGDLLSLGGHTTVLASSGEEALQLFEAEQFDLVVTDLAMPGLSGWQVAKACQERRPGVPVLLITGWGVELNRQQLDAHGVAAVLSKPLRVDEILDAVAKNRR
jgi:GAF domain-containing protein/CheY-like chemotaxis protein